MLGTPRAVARSYSCQVWSDNSIDMTRPVRRGQRGRIEPLEVVLVLAAGLAVLGLLYVVNEVLLR